MQIQDVWAGYLVTFSASQLMFQPDISGVGTHVRTITMHVTLLPGVLGKILGYTFPGMLHVHAVTMVYMWGVAQYIIIDRM